MIYKGKKIKIKIDGVKVAIKLFMDFKWLNNFKSLPEYNKNLLYDLVINKEITITKKPLRIIFAQIFYSVTALSKKYWLDRGWSEDESIKKIAAEQSRRSGVGIKKSLKLKEENFNEWAKKRSTRLEYYLNKGFSEDDAKNELKNRQTTFSKKKCIEKFGNDDGIKVWEERQIKWINTIFSKTSAKLKEINKKKISKSGECYKNKYGEDWCYKMLDDSTYLEDHSSFIKECLLACPNISDLSKFIVNKIEFENQLIIDWIFKSKVLQEFYNMSYKELKKNILNEYESHGTLKKRIGRYGYSWLYNGHICRSTGEYIISKFLFENNIEYQYEGFYPNQNVKPPRGLKYDFYIPKFDLYVEYCGMYKSSNKDYIKRIELKKSHCNENGIKFLFSKNYNDIINELKIKNQK